MLRIRLPYPSDSAQLFERIRDLPWAVWLDSAHPASSQGRYDLMTAQPFCRIWADDAHTWIAQQDRTTCHDEDPFVLLKQWLAQYATARFAFPFEGGALGYFAYELGHRIAPIGMSPSPAAIPSMQLGLYDRVIVVDHQSKEAWLVSHEYDPDSAQQWPLWVDRLSAPFAMPQPPMHASGDHEQAFQVHGEVSSNMTQAQYAQAFHAIQAYIHAGDCYQVNLAQRFRVRASGDAYHAYCQLRRLSPAPYMAYMQLGTAAQPLHILSASPERFLRVAGGTVETRPIKGTRPRLADAAQDRAQAEQLRHSSKDQAENLMIVDLLRNDLGRVCQTGSVQVSELFTLESFAHVHHLVSTVRGQLAPQQTAIDCLRACFPGGSITGAPKLRAMQIIQSLEPDPRGVYCGAIGYIGFDGNMDTNIPIRTAIFHQQQVEFFAGGGIVADSELNTEYQETWDKASAMLKLMAYFSQAR